MTNALSDKRILMFPRTMAMGGTEKVVLQLCEALLGKCAWVGVVSCGGDLVTRLEDMGVPHFDIPDITDKNPATARRVVRELRSIVADNGVNLVHCHHRMAAMYSHVLRGKTLCTVATAHNVFQDGKRCATRAAYHGMHVAACGGQVERNLIDYYGLPHENVVLIPNSVKPFDGPVEPISEIATCPEGVMKVGFVGRLTEAKGPGFLVDAMAMLAKRGIPVRCFMVGDGELGDFLRDKVSELGLTDRICFLGQRDDSQNFLSQVDVCAMPSLWEGLPLVLLEALSVGAPVVASACDGVLDVVTDGKDGLLVESGNAEQLADALERLWRDSALRSRLAEAGKSTFQSGYSYDCWVQKYFKFYEGAGA